MDRFKVRYVITDILNFHIQDESICATANIILLFYETPPFYYIQIGYIL